MPVRRLFYTSAFTISSVLALSAWNAGSRVSLAHAEDAVQHGEISVMPPAPWADNDPADSLYRAARDALSKNEFRRAATLFAEIGQKYANSSYVADALYYRAYALYRAGDESDLREALHSLDTQHARFPKARTNGDADQLAIRIRGTLAKRGDASSAARVSAAASDTTPCLRGGDRDDDDVRTAAMNALLQMDSESALPIIKQVLLKRDACSTTLRKKAVFLLSQKRSSETESLLIDVAKNDPRHAVREDAVFWLGQVHTDKAAAALEEFATSSDDVALREKAVFALSEQNSTRGVALIRLRVARPRRCRRTPRPRDRRTEWGTRQRDAGGWHPRDHRRRQPAPPRRRLRPTLARGVARGCCVFRGHARCGATVPRARRWGARGGSGNEVHRARLPGTAAPRGHGRRRTSRTFSRQFTGARRPGGCRCASGARSRPGRPPGCRWDAGGGFRGERRAVAGVHAGSARARRIDDR